MHFSSADQAEATIRGNVELPSYDRYFIDRVDGSNKLVEVGQVGERAEPDIIVLKLDESSWFPDFRGRVFGVYVVDRGLDVFCCSVSPSRELNFLEYVAEFEDEQEQIYDGVCSPDTECVSYMRVRSLDKYPEIPPGELPPKGCKGGWYSAKDMHDDDLSSRSAINQVLRYGRESCL